MKRQVERTTETLVPNLEITGFSNPQKSQRPVALYTTLDTNREEHPPMLPHPPRLVPPLLLWVLHLHSVEALFPLFSFRLQIRENPRDAPLHDLGEPIAIRALPPCLEFPSFLLIHYEPSK